MEVKTTNLNNSNNKKIKREKKLYNVLQTLVMGILKNFKVKDLSERQIALGRIIRL